MTKRMLIMLGGILLLVLILAGGFFLHIKKLMAAAPKPGPQTVTATKVQALDWQPQLSAVGSVMPVRGVDVTPEVAGQVREVRFRSGQDVKKGEVLFELNDDTDRAQLASLQAAADLAATVLKRDKGQFDAQAIAQAQVDADTADLKGKKALVAQQEALIGKKTIRAPFAGKLGITTVNPGQYVNPGDKLVTLQTIDPVYVDFNLPQKDVGNLSVGQAITVATDGFPGEHFAGRVTAISPKVDPATRNLVAEATLPNPKCQLLPGMFANVSVILPEQKHYVTVPAVALIHASYGDSVFVTEDKDGAKWARQKFVKSGAKRGDFVAITDGLQAGDVIVTGGAFKLRNNTKIVVDNKLAPDSKMNPTPENH